MLDTSKAVKVKLNLKMDGCVFLKPAKTQRRACPGVEPGTSRTQSENHATRPTGQDLSTNRKTFIQSLRSLPTYRSFLMFFVKLCRGKTSSLVTIIITTSLTSRFYLIDSHVHESQMVQVSKGFCFSH